MATLPQLLIVDDEPQSREAIRRTLHRDFTTIEADSGAAALAVLEKNPDISVILSDERMPNQSGTELLSTVKSLYPKIIRVMISGQIQLEDMITAINKAEVHRFILKPWENHVLRLQMQEALMHHRDLDQMIKLQQLAITDPVTHLTNRRFFQERIHEEVERAHRHNRVFSVIMIDVDFFKKFNDTYGHPEGDKALASLAQRINRATRAADSLSRYGGEEFVMVLPETPKQAAFDVAERIRKDLESSSIGGLHKDYKFTLSLGVASFPEDGKTAEEVVKAADQALYRAKLQGRNRVEV